MYVDVLFQWADRYSNRDGFPHIQALIVSPNFLKEACACKCVCMCVFICAWLCVNWERERQRKRGEGKRKLCIKTSSNWTANICVPQNTRALWFALHYLFRQGKKSLTCQEKLSSDLCAGLQTIITSIGFCYWPHSSTPWIIQTYIPACPDYIKHKGRSDFWLTCFIFNKQHRAARILLFKKNLIARWWRPSHCCHRRDLLWRAIHNQEVMRRFFHVPSQPP